MKEMSKKAQADLLLVLAIRKNNDRETQKAFEVLFNKYYKSLLFYFRPRLENEQELEEFVMEVFEKMSINLERFDENLTVFSTWLFKIANNLFIDKLRKKKLDTKVFSQLANFDNEEKEKEFDTPSLERTPEEKLIQKQKLKTINVIVNSISNNEMQTMIKLRFYEGFSYEEIGKETGCPIGTVKAMIHRAKAILKEEFENVGIYA
jgi:RNA polymerase sigma-70 factor (ECF subfamily)